LVHHEELSEANRRRHRLVTWLVAGRTLAIAIGVVLWWFNPGRMLKDPMNGLVHHVIPRAGMRDRFARLIAAALIVTGILRIVILPAWRLLERRSGKHLFHTARPGWRQAEGHLEPGGPNAHPPQESAATAIG
jgi:hypothetical protein